MNDLTFCKNWGEKIAARHPEDLSSAERAALHQHLLECSQCARAYEAFNRLEARIHELPQAASLPSLLPKLQAIQQDPAPFSPPSYHTFCLVVQGFNTFTEISSDNMEMTELVIEEAMSHVLLKLFDGGMVEDVTLHLVAGLPGKRHGYSIQIRVSCPLEQFALSPRTEENMCGELLKNTFRLMKELFTSLEVANVTMLPHKRKMQMSDV